VSDRKKRELRKVDAAVASFATRHLDPTKANIRHGVARFARHLQTLGPLDLAKLNDDPKRLGLIAHDFFTRHAPKLGVQSKEAEPERPNLSKAQDAAMPDFGLREGRS
jgi:hypothetical protein